MVVRDTSGRWNASSFGLSGFNSAKSRLGVIGADKSNRTDLQIVLPRSISLQIDANRNGQLLTHDSSHPFPERSATITSRTIVVRNLKRHKVLRKTKGWERMSVDMEIKLVGAG